MTSLPRKSIPLPNGITLSYLDQGKGPATLLFIHGLAINGFCWQRNFPEMAKQYRCIAVDLPGHGYSPALPGSQTYTMELLAASILHLIGTLGLENVFLVGHSMGAQVCLTAALMAPKALLGMVLCSPAGFEKFTHHEVCLLIHSLEYARWWGNDEHSLRQSLQAGFWNRDRASAQLEQRFVDLYRKLDGKEYRRAVTGAISAMLHEPVLDKLSQIHTPTCLLFGEQDALIPNKTLHHTTTRALATAGARKMPNAGLFMFQQAGHFVMWESAVAVNKLIRDFVAATLKKEAA